MAAPLVVIDLNGPQGFKVFARDLRRFYPELRTQLGINLRLAGKLVLADAKSNAGDSRRTSPRR